MVILRCWIRIRIRKKWIRIRNPELWDSRVHKTTYAPMIYTALRIMFLMWADSQMLVWASSLQCALQYRIGTAHGLGFVENRLPWTQASESARLVSLPLTCQTASVMQPNRHFCVCYISGLVWSRWGHHCGVCMPSVSALSSIHPGDSNPCPPDQEL